MCTPPLDFHAVNPVVLLVMMHRAAKGLVVPGVITFSYAHCVSLSSLDQLAIIHLIVHASFASTPRRCLGASVRRATPFKFRLLNDVTGAGYDRLSLQGLMTRKVRNVFDCPSQCDALHTRIHNTRSYGQFMWPRKLGGRCATSFKWLGACVVRARKTVVLQCTRCHCHTCQCGRISASGWFLCSSERR